MVQVREQVGVHVPRECEVRVPEHPLDRHQRNPTGKHERRACVSQVSKGPPGDLLLEPPGDPFELVGQPPAVDRAPMPAGAREYQVVLLPLGIEEFALSPLTLLVIAELSE